MRANDLFVHVTASGGGYGDPLERSPDRVLRDIVQGRIDREQASAAYGVVVTGEAAPRVDTAATDAARGRMRRHDRFERRVG